MTVCARSRTGAISQMFDHAAFDPLVFRLIVVTLCKLCQAVSQSSHCEYILRGKAGQL